MRRGCQGRRVIFLVIVLVLVVVLEFWEAAGNSPDYVDQQFQFTWVLSMAPLDRAIENGLVAKAIV